MAGQLIIKFLEAPDIDQVSKFRMPEADDQPLRDFIRRTAMKSARSNLTQTYVAKYDGERRIAGYISLMCAEVSLEETYAIPDKEAANQYTYQPAVRIARLGVEGDHQGKGIGKALVAAAIGIVQNQIQPSIGCRFVVLDAKRKSVAFYERLGFRLIDTQTNRGKETPVMFLDLQDLN